MSTRAAVLWGLMAVVVAGLAGCRALVAECGECDYGEVRCDGQVFQRCFDDAGSDCASWHPLATCAADARCVPDAALPCRDCGGCTAGTSRCVDGKEQRCLDDPGCVAWDAPRACADGLACLDGTDRCAACADECAAGERRCAGPTARQACASNGACLRWGLPDACEVGEVCSGLTLACAPICALHDLVPGGPACGLQGAGAAFCWGPNPSGALGTGSLDPAVADLPVAAAVFGPAVAQLAVTGGSAAPGATTTCARLQDRSVWCVGSNYRGALGAGAGGALSLLALPVSGLLDAVDLAAGDNHLCAVSASGEVRCWGAGALGQLGGGASADAATPVAVTGLPGPARRVWCSGDACCAAGDAGGPWCWGTQPGTLAPGPPLDQGPTPGGVAAMALSGGQRCLLTTAGGIACAGRNFHGSLGDGTLTSRATFAAVQVVAGDAVALSAYSQHLDGTFCALRAGGTLWCWGPPAGFLPGEQAAPTFVDPLGAPVQGMAGGLMQRDDGRWFANGGAGWRALFNCQ